MGGGLKVSAHGSLDRLGWQIQCKHGFWTECKIVKTGKKIPPTPAHLSERSAAIWCELAVDRCNSTERRLLLEQALSDLDRADTLREQVQREGATVTSARSKLARAHPALKIEAEFRRRFLRTWSMLRLTWGAQVLSHDGREHPGGHARFLPGSAPPAHLGSCRQFFPTDLNEFKTTGHDGQKQRL